MKVRTRFAPSPTGYLHIGGARTALYAYLYARHYQGEFILRIEDTDRERSTQESVQAILDGMAWLGLDYDEGPFYQTERMDRYQEIIQQLLESRQAYRCQCSKERLEKLREEQLKNKEKPRYDGSCREANLPTETSDCVIRFRNPQTGHVVFQDQVYGEISVANHELDDLIIARSDGMPTYNFTVVVDDWDMQITHVIRGDDHINNTPRQINILKALGGIVPIYAHLPTILGADGKRLSKRHGAASVLEYQEQGILPHALLNYLVRLGWSHGNQEIFSKQEMIDLFDVKDVSKSAAALNPEKLLWLNQHYLKSDPVNEIAEVLQWHFEQKQIDITQGPSLNEIISVQRERSKTLVEIVEKSLAFYQEINSYDEKAVSQHFSPEIIPALMLVRDQLKNLSDWSQTNIHEIVIKVAEQLNIKLGSLAQPIRIALTGGTVSPPIDATIYLMGREKVAQRLTKVVEFIESK